VAVVVPGHAGDAVSVPLGQFSLYLDGDPGLAHPAPPPLSKSTPPRDAAHTGGYGIGFHYSHTKSISGGIEVRRHDYFVDDNLKGERPHESAMFRMRFLF
jgi:hypothetical protein